MGLPFSLLIAPSPHGQALVTISRLPATEECCRRAGAILLMRKGLKCGMRPATKERAPV